MKESHEAATTRPGPAGIDPDTLTYQQFQGWNCALCGRTLGADRPLGTVTIGRGATRTTYEVRACAPSCAETSTGPAAETEWREAIEHAAGCPACRTPGAGCETGERLLHTYEEAARRARSGEGV
ncbi:hypothetical protein [Streptomyces malaysiensis]|uniref:Uncharacterized protein n=1 Tax=Streptomyces malaysiensis subsp. samsunensis TaxID=459658 RepID=A0A9X2LUR2_STRMQ|nr:hypothetical protein [Streptomyces samsunensis]MCQ8830825.1 hypothetical protein [Streptomyces samsunensis]